MKLMTQFWCNYSITNLFHGLYKAKFVNYIYLFIIKVEGTDERY